MSRGNPFIPQEFLGPQNFDALSKWLITLDLTPEEDKRAVFDWSHLTQTKITRKMLDDHFTAKGTYAP